MSKFKVGDKVIRVRDLRGFTRNVKVGTEFEVVSRGENGLGIFSVGPDDSAALGGVYDFDLERVNPKVKVGDKVRILEVGGNNIGNSLNKADYDWWTIDYGITAGDVLEVGPHMTVIKNDHPVYGLESQSFELYVEPVESVEPTEDDLEQAVVAAQAALKAFLEKNSAEKLVESFPNGTVFTNNETSKYVKGADGKFYAARKDVGPWTAEAFSGKASDIVVDAIE